MFAYCLNNPINATDKSGKWTDNYGDDYASWLGNQVGQWIYEYLIPDDIKQKCHATVQAFFDNIVINAGVGLGFGGGFGLLGIVDVEAGVVGDICSLYYANGEIQCGQENRFGLSATIRNIVEITDQHNEYMFKQNGKVTESPVQDKSVWEIVSYSGYFIAGFKFSFGIDILGFLRDFHEIWFQ